MRGLNLIALLSTVLFLAVAGPSRAAVQDAEVAAELRGLAASIDHLAGVIASQKGSEEQEVLFRKLELAITYLNFRSRRIEMLEQDIQSARASRDQIESSLNLWVEKLKELDDSGLNLSNDEKRERKEEIDLRIRLVSERISLLDNEIVTLENKIYDLQNQIDSVEEFVQKNLNL